MTAETTAKTRERLTRERVVEAALHVMDTDGLEAVSMRRVAREVGVEAMSLYHHVRDKDDLIDAICARVMHDFRIGDPDAPWLERAASAAREWRRVLMLHPNVITLFSERRKPMTDIAALRPMEHALAILHEAGLSDRDAVRMFNVLGGYIMGFVMMELGQMFSAGTMDTDEPDPRELQQLLPPDMPRLAASLPHLLHCEPDDQFELGLDILLRGVLELGSGKA
jgi:AcrR family transcriptional regulator